MNPDMDFFENDIKDLILVVRGEKVLLDFHIATLFQVETKALKQAVKRNIERFPPDFMFRLLPEEWDFFKNQVIGSKRGGIRYLPMVFTEQGVAMLASVLRSQEAIDMSIQIIRTFIKLRRMVSDNQEFARQLKEVEEKHDSQMQRIYDSLDRLFEQEANRKKIGFKQKKQS